MAKKGDNIVQKNLEELYIAKLIDKYESLGYNTYREHRSNRSNIRVDLYCYHPKTKDRIIFEVKARKEMSKVDIEHLIQRRNEIRKSFPPARIELVVAEDIQERTTVKSMFNDLILDYIKEHHGAKINNAVEGFISFYDVEEVSFDLVDFRDFVSIQVKGTATLRFFIETEQYIGERRLIGESLSEGIPFDFDIQLNLIDRFPFPDRYPPIYKISKKSKIDFDLSEFKRD